MKKDSNFGAFINNMYIADDSASVIQNQAVDDFSRIQVLLDNSTAGEAKLKKVDFRNWEI